MKIRTGFVSNSSSGSFSVPSSLLSDEQKEILLSLDDMKKEKAKLQEMLGSDKDRSWENSKNNYPINDEYHRIYQEMVDNGNWHDRWERKEDKSDGLISGGTMMDNGSIRLLVTAIGIDVEMFQFDEQCETKLATHPEAVKFFINMHKRSLKQFEEMDEEKRKTEIEFGHIIPEKSPYELPDKEFGSLGKNTLQFEAEDDFSYVKDKVVENEN